MLFVEIVFQLAHSFSIFSAILTAIFGWVCASDINSLLEKKITAMSNNSGLFNSEGSDQNSKPSDLAATKIQMSGEVDVTEKDIDKIENSESFD